MQRKLLSLLQECVRLLVFVITELQNYMTICLNRYRQGAKIL